MLNKRQIQNNSGWFPNSNHSIFIANFFNRTVRCNNSRLTKDNYNRGAIDNKAWASKLSLLLMVVLVCAVYGKADVMTYRPSAQGYANAQAVTSYETDQISLVFSKGSGSVNPAYYQSGGGNLRVYGNNMISVKAKGGYTILEVTINYSGTKAFTSNIGSFDGNVWSGTSQSVVFSVEGGSGNNQISSIAVSYEKTETDPYWLADYYSSLEGLKGGALKKAAKETARKNYHRIPYGTEYNGGLCTWQGFYYADTRMVGGELCWWDMYSEINVPAPSYTSHGSLNIEHAVPNSWWGTNDTQKKGTDAYYDLFNLNPSDATANSYKQNYPLGEISRLTWSNEGDITMIGVPTSNTGGGAAYVFEPADEYKGDFARAYFYVFTAYDDISWRTSSVNYMYDRASLLTLKPWAYQMLLQWSREDPISEKEIERNEAIYQYQGNRNPFIDNPELAEHIWGSKNDTGFHYGGSPGGDEGDDTPGGGSSVGTLYEGPDNVEIVVYNMQGVRLSVSSPYEVGSLAPGLYIVNGQKVLVK